MTDLDTRMQLGAAYRRDPLGTIDRYEAYQRLDGAIAQRVDGFLARHGHEEAAAIALRQLVESAGFGAVRPEVQATLLEAAAEHPEPEAIRRLQWLAADGAFQDLPPGRADAEIGRVAGGSTGPSVGALVDRANMPAVPHDGLGALEVTEGLSQILHYAEGIGGFELAHVVGELVGPGAAAVAAPVGGGVLAFAGAALGIYGPVHQAQHAHEAGRAIGVAAAHGAGFVRQLAEHAGGATSAPRDGAEARGAAAADRCWNGLRPSDRVALMADGARFFAALDRAVLQRALGRD